MSKASLKKELDKLDRQQLVELILDSYAASKDTKAYFEFFLNPDVEALLEKKTDQITREVNRTKHGRCRARISIIRNSIKEFQSFGVGPDYVLKLQLSTIAMLISQERWYYFTETLTNGIYKLTAEYIELANTAGMISESTEKLNNLLRDSTLGRERIRKNVAETAARTVADISAGIPTKKKR